MRALLNLAIEPVERHRRFKVFVGGAALLCVLGCPVLAWRVHSVHRAVSTVRAQNQMVTRDIEQLSAERQELDEFFLVRKMRDSTIVQHL